MARLSFIAIQTQSLAGLFFFQHILCSSGRIQVAEKSRKNGKMHLEQEKKKRFVSHCHDAQPCQISFCNSQKQRCKSAKTKGYGSRWNQLVPPSNLAARTLSLVEHTLSKFCRDPWPVRRGLVAAVKCYFICAKNTFFLV